MSCKSTESEDCRAMSVILYAVLLHFIFIIHSTIILMSNKFDKDWSLFVVSQEGFVFIVIYKDSLY